MHKVHQDQGMDIRAMRRATAVLDIKDRVCTVFMRQAEMLVQPTKGRKRKEQGEGEEESQGRRRGRRRFADIANLGNIF